MKRLLARLFRARRTHNRSDGPVVIDPDVRETIHVRGKATK